MTDESAARPGVTSTPPEGPLRSEFADDPDFAVILEPYLAGAEEKVRALQAAAKALPDDREPVRALAHQIKGSAGGYGFPSVTEAAADVLLACCEGGADGGPNLRPSLDRLLDLLGRMSA